ncbi:MAG: hypothetical protein ACX93T_04380, partial [Bacteroidota bacterium]
MPTSIIPIDRKQRFICAALLSFLFLFQGCQPDTGLNMAEEATTSVDPRPFLSCDTDLLVPPSPSPVVQRTYGGIVNQLSSGIASAMPAYAIASRRRCGLVTTFIALSYLFRGHLINSKTPSTALPTVYGGYRAFGAQAWYNYFGVDVGPEPALPHDIVSILKEKAPFMLESEERRPQRVGANHLLTL